jgi:hypothetical protein
MQTLTVTWVVAFGEILMFLVEDLRNEMKEMNLS